MKRVLSVALVAVSLLSVALFFVEQSHSIHAASKTSMMLYEHDTTTRFFGNKKNGGYETYTNPVYDESDKVRLGSSDGTCFYVSQTVYQCEWTMTLPGGKIVLAGADTVKDLTTTYAVIGGTGLYSASKGDVMLNYFHAEKGYEYKYTFNLI